MTSANSTLSLALLARRWATVSAGFATLVVVLGASHHDGVAAITVYSVTCFLAWVSVFMQHGNVRAARAMQPADER